jgi:hypothetical protein
MPSANEIAYVAARFDLDSLRDVQGHVYHRLKRNKTLGPVRGWHLATIDGHEQNCSYDHWCPQCLKRDVEVNGEKRFQYYHRQVALQLVADRFHLMLDCEPVLPGEDEVDCALRLLERVLERWPQCFDLLLGDGLYAQGRVFTLLARHGKHGLMVLKDEKRDLLKDARGLFAAEPSKTVWRGKTRCQVWDIGDFKSWPQAGMPVRVIRSVETTTHDKRLGKKKAASLKAHAKRKPAARKKRANKKPATLKPRQWTEESEWIWVTDLTLRDLPTGDAVSFGHRRWDIENYGFNELSNQWHADHYYHHDPVAIVAFWLILFIAHAVFHCFYQRNLKPQARARRSMIYWARLMLAELAIGTLWPLPP